MATWAEFEAASPQLAANGRRLIERSGIGEMFLASVRWDDLPRLHPIYVGIVEGRLVAFLHDDSPKTVDLATDGRYAMHAHQDPTAPSEFGVRGRASEPTDSALRAAAAAVWAFPTDRGGYRFFEFDVEHVIYGDRPTADSWPPRYSSWRDPSGGD